MRPGYHLNNRRRTRTVSTRRIRRSVLENSLLREQAISSSWQNVTPSRRLLRTKTETCVRQASIPNRHEALRLQQSIRSPSSSPTSGSVGAVTVCCTLQGEDPPANPARPCRRQKRLCQ
ncbi:hypothetical protein CGRA01v4_06331 [Colletotrichum graminicola]|nr:hypothetical protein CGRA01v4_06331 [Colletotrichum graminicola]